ncbi:uncharacterized protein METZ01_LOCUS61776 [marine metagenome]|uniref:Uncharacterized protein n=1 Tax=marine metagenome TaxID=408172 RepID=A0A381SY35_9ZZZZ
MFTKIYVLQESRSTLLFEKSTLNLLVKFIFLISDESILESNNQSFFLMSASTLLFGE